MFLHDKPLCECFFLKSFRMPCLSIFLQITHEKTKFPMIAFIDIFFILFYFFHNGFNIANETIHSKGLKTFNTLYRHFKKPYLCTLKTVRGNFQEQTTTHLWFNFELLLQIQTKFIYVGKYRYKARFFLILGNYSIQHGAISVKIGEILSAPYCLHSLHK